MGPGYRLRWNPLARPDGFFLTRVGARASCHALILTTVELMSPVMRTQEARCHMPRGRHGRPIT